MPNNTSKKSQSALQENKETVGAEKSKATKPAEKPQAKKQAKESGKSAAPKVPKAPKAPKVPEPPVAPVAPVGSGKNPVKTSKSRKPRKQHKKKGSGSKTPPTSIRWTDAGFGALLAIEAANPEMTRGQIFTNALQLYAKHIAFLPAIQLARLDSDTLITLSGASAKWEKSCKKIMREIILAELDDEEKARLVGELEIEIQNLRDERLAQCRIAGIPITRDLTVDMNFTIATLMEKKKEKEQKAYQDAYDSAIQILTAYKPCDPGDTPKPGETLPPDDQENPEKPKNTNV